MSDQPTYVTEAREEVAPGAEIPAADLPPVMRSEQRAQATRPDSYVAANVPVEDVRCP